MKLAACFKASSVHFTACAARVPALTNLMLCETRNWEERGQRILTTSQGADGGNHEFSSGPSLCRWPEVSLDKGVPGSAPAPALLPHHSRCSTLIL